MRDIGNMKMKLITLVLGAVVALSGFGATPIEYLDEKGEAQTCTDYTVVRSGLDIELKTGWYAVTNKGVASYGCRVTGDAKLILADGASLRCIGDEAPGVAIAAGTSLTVYGQKLRTGALDAEGNYANAPGIGPEHGEAGGSLTVCGGRVTAAAFGGSSSLGPGIGCALVVKGGVVTATAEGKGAGVSGALEVSGGTLRAEGGRNGGTDVATTDVTITGGSVFARTLAGTPKDAAGNPLLRLTLLDLPLDDSSPLKEVVLASPYGSRDIFPLDGKAYLWLPAGDYRVAVVTPEGEGPLYYRAVLKSLPVEASPLGTLGFTVDGLDVLGAGKGDGWDYTFTNGLLRLTSAGKDYHLSGTADDGEVRVVTTTVAAMPTVILKSAVLYTMGQPAISGCIVKADENEFLKAGADAATAKFVKSGEVRNDPYFRAAKKVKVSVPDVGLPVKDVSVSNRAERIEGVAGRGVMDYWVMPDDDVFVSYRPADGYLQVGENPIAYRAVREDFTLTAADFPVGEITPFTDGGHYIASHGGEWLDLRAVTNGIERLRAVCVSDPTLTLDGTTDWAHVLQDDSTRLRWIEIYDGPSIRRTLMPFRAVYRDTGVYGLCDPETKQVFVNGGTGAFELGAIPEVPYRLWENGAFTNRICLNHFPLMAGTNTLENGRWYVVDGALTCDRIDVQGTANLILTDRAQLEVKNGIAGGTLVLYAQTAGAGSLTVSGGAVTAVVMHGGRIAADEVRGPALTVYGGTLAALDIGERTMLTVNGGSVVPTYAEGASVTNAAGKGLVCVTVANLGGYAGPLALKGLDGYGADGLYPIDGSIYLHLPVEKACLFDVTVAEETDLLCYADVGSEPIEIRAGVTGFTVNGRDLAERRGTGWTFADGVLSLVGGTNTYTLSGSLRDVMRVSVEGDVPVTLSDAAVKTSDGPALTFASGTKAKLLLRGMNALVSTNAPAVRADAGLEISIPKDEKLLTQAELSGSPSAISVGTASFADGLLLMAGNDFASARPVDTYKGEPYLSVGRGVLVTVTSALPAYLAVEVTDRAQKVEGVKVDGGTAYRVMKGDHVEISFEVPAWTNLLVASENPIVIDPVLGDVAIGTEDVRLEPFNVYEDGRHYIVPTVGGERLDLTSLTNGVVEFACETDPGLVEAVDWSNFATNWDCRVFSVRMYSKEGLVHHLVPLQTEDEMAAGLFDLVSGRSFGNRGGQGAYWCYAVETEPIAYLKWIDALKRHETLTRAVYEVVTNATATFADGKWYAVTSEVSSGSVEVDGSSHLLLTGDAALAADAITGGALAVYGQPGGGGALTVSGTVSAALTCEGGFVSVGTLAGGPLAVTGGTLIGDVDGERSATIDGGCVKVGLTNCVNRSGQPVHRVTAVVGSALRADRGGLTVEGLEGYGTNDICAVGGEICLWLPDGVHHFALADGTRSYRYLAEVSGTNVRVEPLKLGFSVNDVDVIGGSGTGWRYDGEVLTLGRAMSYVLTGSVTDDEVQIDVAEEGATVILSNAVVATEGRPALVVEKSVSLQMADGESTFATTNAAPTVTVAAGATVTVGLAPNADRIESAIGVFNHGGACAVSGSGAVKVESGTFFAWADNQAVETNQLKLSFNNVVEVMRAGATPETAKYVTECNDGAYVRVGPAVTITVRNVPHVTGFTVSNAVETIDRREILYGGTYRVMLGDDVYVGFTIGPDCFTRSPNPLAYVPVTGDVTVDANAIRVLPYLPYRTWNEATRQMEDRLCTNYEVVTADLADFEDGKWYAVTDKVERGTVAVNGAAHLILCDGATLTATGGTNEAGVAVADGSSLAIHGQTKGTGALIAHGGWHAAGIGGGNGGAGGTVTVDGGVVTAKGGYGGAGIGGGTAGKGGTVAIRGGEVTAIGNDGSDEKGTGAGIGGSFEDGGVVTITGGRVKAVGGTASAGIGGSGAGDGGTVMISGGEVTADGGQGGSGIGGGGTFGDGGQVTISGGHVVATAINAPAIGGGATGNGARVTITGGTVEAESFSIEWDFPDIGGGKDADHHGTLTIDGGSVKASRTKEGLAKNSLDFKVYCVTAKCPGVEGLVSLGGLEGYGTNDICTVKNEDGENCVYLWLPNGEHLFRLSDGTTPRLYFAAVNGRDITVEPVPLGFFVNGENILECSGTGWNYDEGVLSLDSAMTYVLSGESTNDLVQVRVAESGATVVLSNAAVFTEGRPALEVMRNALLLMAGGESCLVASNGAPAMSVAEGAELVVNLAPGGKRTESAVGVFNSGNAVAVAGAGAVTVEDGTLFVWSDQQAVEAPSRFTCRGNEMMEAGESPEALKSVTDCGTEKCVLASPGVTIVVSDDIPHVTDVVVSNRTGVLVGTPVTGGTAYRVVMRDDVFVGFTVEDAIYNGPNPLCFPELKGDITVDRKTIPALGFRVYQDGQHSIESSGREWIDTGYVPTVNTRIVADMNPLQKTGDGQAFFGVTGGGSSTDGILLRYLSDSSVNGWFCNANSDQAQIPGLENTRFTAELKAGEMKLNEQSREITTTGAPYQGSIYLFCGNNGGTSWRPQAMRLYSFTIYDTVDGKAKCVRDFLPCEAEDGSVCGLYDRITKVVYLNKGDGSFALGEDGLGVPYRAWNETTRQLEDRRCYEYEVVTEYTDTFEDGKWYVVQDKVERGTITVNGTAHLILCDGATLTATGNIKVEPGNALAIYGQTFGTGELVAIGSRNRAGIGAGAADVGGGAVTVNGGAVTALGGDYGAGIGGAYRGSGGTVTVNGGTVTATGGFGGAGIGGGSNPDAAGGMKKINGGTVTVNGGVVTANGGGNASGIGGGWRCDGAMVTVNGGTVTAESGLGMDLVGDDVVSVYECYIPDIGSGRQVHNVLDDGTLTIDGGSVKAARTGKGELAKNSLNLKVYRVTAKCPSFDKATEDKPLVLEGLERYGTNDIYAVDGSVCLWLPNGEHWFTLSDGTATCHYCAIVNNGDIVVEPISAGLFVNGADIGSGSGPGWTYGEGDVLSLNGNGPFVLSGTATNGTVQVRVAQQGATVVLSNAVVMTSGRPALEAARSVTLLMAGGISYLGSESGSAAVAVAAGAEVTVGLADGADRNEAKIGVFDSGNAAAISGTGAVTVNGGTFLVWAGQQAVENPSVFTYGLNEMMKTGRDFDSLTYTISCDDAPCVLVAPGVDVTAANIPHVAGFTVSNGVETIAGGSIPGGMRYRVVLGDDVYVGYTLEKGYGSRSANPLVYRSVEGDITLDAGAIEILPHLPYRAWNETTWQMEDRLCADYEVVTADTTEFADGKWYAVTDAVSTTNLTVNGAAHLILCAGKTLTADAVAGGALTVYGQSEGLGELIVSGAVSSALTCEGGIVSAGTIAGESLAVVGGRVTVTDGVFGTVTIDGGTVRTEKIGDTATITGGSVWSRVCESQPTNGTGAPVYRVTVKCPGLDGLVRVEGLAGYGTNDIYAVKDDQGVECVCLWLPAGTHRFSFSDGTKTHRYRAIVMGKDALVEPLVPVGFFVNGEDIALDGRGPFWSYGADRVLTLYGGISGNYLLTGEATNDLVQVRVTEPGATITLSNTVVMTSGRPAFVVERNASILMKGGESCIVATNAVAAVTVARDVTLTVGLPPRTGPSDSAVGVFNVGYSVAIGGAGKVVVNGGTLTAWADVQGFEVPDNVTCDANEVMMTGDDPETLRYVPRCDGKPCVLFGQAATVTVKDDIPHVTDVVVSNAVGRIEGIPAEGGTAYRVMRGDDVYVGYTLAAGYASKSANPLVYAAVAGDITVDANTIRVLPIVPYRAWNGATGQMEDRTCTDYTVVTADTTALEDGKWYVVEGPVACKAITVSGAAHLILCDGKTLTADAVAGGALTVCGQSEGLGELIVSGAVSSALTCEGGIISAGTIAGESLAVVGGRVTVTDGVSGTVTIDGGTVRTKKFGEAVTIDGGNVSVSARFGQTNFVNRAGRPLHCVTAKVEGLKVERLNVEGLEGYGTNDIYPVEGSVYLWLPDGEHWFALSDGTTTHRYHAVVKGLDVTVDPIDGRFFVNGEDLVLGSGTGWSYDENGVLSLDGAMTYVLTGTATNDEVQVRVAQQGATVVLSNAVVMASMRPAFCADRSVSLLMAGGASYLVATNDSPALAVAEGATLTVGLAPGADRAEAMVGVFNYGDRTAAIARPGSVVVGGGTFCVWADRQAVWTPENFTFGIGEVMLTGAEPDAMKYAMACDDAPCVLVAPCATVTVREIPHVTVTTVSNAVQALVGTAVEGGTAYRVLPGDDVFVGYTVEDGYFSRTANPIVYAAVEGDITVDAGSIEILRYIPYRAWNGTTGRMEDLLCTEYAVVTAGTTDFTAGKWYAVTGTVSCGSVRVVGAAHLILCDEATLTADAITGGTLAIHGQPSGCGALKVSGTVSVALTCEGGLMSAGTIAGDSLAVVGGTLAADAVEACAATIDGGSVKAGKVDACPVNACGAAVHCVKVKAEGLKVERLKVEGLGIYGTNDIYPIDGSVYLWLPKGEHWFSLSDGEATFRYCAVVQSKAITVEPLGPVGFFVNGVDVGKEGSGDGWSYQENVLTLASAMTYVLSGEATNDEVQVKANASGATVVLSNAVVFASGRPALAVAEDATLLMAGGTSYLAATNESAAVAVATDRMLAVGLAPGAKRADAMVGVFNCGAVKAIAGSGAVAVSDGTFFVWADEQAVETPVSFTFDAAAEVMMTGETPETLMYRDACTDDPCVLVGPSVTITVKGNIPLASGFTVSNAVEAIRGSAVEGGTAYRVMEGDDVYVHYTVAENCTLYSPNPLVYLAVASNVVVGADTISILPNVPYRAWNAARRQVEECVCTNYTVVTADTAAFADGRWYVVTGMVSAANLTVDGAAHLILCDEATLAADAITGGALAVYGQSGGCGELIVSGAVAASLTCEGGVVSAGTVAGESLAVDGGTLAADAVSSVRTTIDGGSVKAGLTDPVNRAGQPVHRVTAVVGSALRADRGGLTVEGLDGYGTNDICPIDDRVYLWLPDGEHWFSLSDGTKTHSYCAVVNGMDLTVEPLVPVGFFVNGVEVGQTAIGDNWVYISNSRTLMLTSSGPYVLSGVATNDNVKVDVIWPGATIVLSNAVMVASERPVVNANQSTTILMAGGTSYLASKVESSAITIGENMSLRIGLAPGADSSEAMVEVFNDGGASAIGESGSASVAVDGGTLFAWSDKQAAGVSPDAFTCGANEVMMAGKTPESLRYATACDTDPCLLVAPGVTVTVKDGIPHVTGLSVSNAVQAIEGAAVEGGTAYRVLSGDDVFVSYTVEEGYVSKAANPLVYADVRGDVTVEAGTVPTIPVIPYRAWNETTRQMEDRVCTDYTVVTADTATFEDGQWYVVTGAVERGTITVNGAAHLILCGDATLTATGGENLAGVAVANDNALTIYGQANGTGELVAKGGCTAAGIGANSGEKGGAVTVNGGIVTATGGEFAAGIGGGYAGDGGVIAVNGGTVTATGRGMLPEGYTAVEYIESTPDGGQYINTEYTPNKDTKVVCRLLDEGTDSHRQFGAAFGTRVGYTWGRCMHLWLRHFDSNRPSYGRAGTEDWREGSTFPFGEITTVTCQGPTCSWVNDAGTKESGMTLTTGYDVEQEKGLAPLTIFAINSTTVEGGCNPQEFWSFRLYSFQIYEGETLVHDFVPCVEKVTGKAGLYDAIGDKFHDNRGEGLFAHGAAVTIDEAADIGGGSAGAGATVTINGGSVKAETIQNAPTNGANEAVWCVTAKWGGAKSEEGGAKRLRVEGLDGYGTNDIYAVEGAVYLWLPNGTYDFTISDGETTCRYHAVVDGEDIEVEPLPQTVPVTPGTPSGPYPTAAAATNAMGIAVIAPRDDVAAALGSDEARQAYREMFGFAVTGGGESWSVEAVLCPEAWTNLVLSAQEATRQIPVADIAALPPDTPTNVTVKACCVPGFYYSVYSGSTVTNLKAVVSDKARNVLCGPGRDVEFSGVVKPSDAAGFFTIGVREAPDVQPSDGHRRLPIIVPPVLPQ